MDIFMRQVHEVFTCSEIGVREIRMLIYSCVVWIDGSDL